MITQKKEKVLISSDSINTIKLISKNEYREILRKYLPEEYFKPDLSHIKHYLFHLGIYLSGMYLIAVYNILPLNLLVSIVMGVSLASLTFFLHDLCHGSIVQSKKLEYCLGLSVGMFNLFAPTFWKRIHNLHHARTGNVDDPDRSYIFSERPKNLHEILIYKTRISNESVHPFLCLVFMCTGFFWYFLNTMLYGFVGKNTSSEDKKYQMIRDLFKTKVHKAIVLCELIIIIGFQIFLYNFVAKQNFLTYSFIALMPVAIAHFIAMSYIHTNHFLSPLTGEIDDPLVNSLSINDTYFVDKLFLNFSHHVEHHLFPAMSSSHYPKVRKLLEKMYPNRFQLLTMFDAMKMLLSTPRIYGGTNDFTKLVSPDGHVQVNCLLPTN